MFLLKSLVVLLGVLRAVNSYSVETYSALVDAAFWSQVAYCINGIDQYDVVSIHPSLEPGPLPESCPTLQFCNDAKNSGAEIVKLIGPSPYIEETAAAGYIALDHSDKKIVLSWKGSSTIRDWVNDVTIPLIDYVPIVENKIGVEICKNCSVHKGFYNALQRVADDVFPTLVELSEKYPDYSLLITGHSLGGALVTISVIEAQLLGLHPTAIGLAAPKAADPNYFAWVDNVLGTNANLKFIEGGGDISRENVFVNVVHKADLVPLVPPTKIWAQGGVFFRIDQIELPHPQSVTELTGKYQFTSLLEYAVDIKDAKTIGEVFELYGHNHYFMSIYGCNSTASIVDLIPGAA